MASISSAKAMGGVGSILVLLTAIPGFGFILGIVGLILILIAIKVISDQVKDHKIFSDMMISVVLAIVALVIAGVSVVVSLYKLLGLGSFTGGSFVPGPNVQAGDWVAFVLTIIPFLVAIWVLFLISAVFIRRSLDSTGQRVGVGLFGTTGLIYLIGAATVIIGIGLILIFVAEILLAVSFFSINENNLKTGELKSTV